MSNDARRSIDHRSVELDGIRYVILRESVFELLCQQASVPVDHPMLGDEPSVSDFDLDQPSLADKLVRRRRAAGLSQAELARRAGVRPETLNRVERGRTTPDFVTGRKVVVAMNAAEQAHAALSISSCNQKEPENVDGK